MSGHSKWANIKNRKGAQDKKRSVAFTKASKDILTALRNGGGSGLKDAIDKAKAVNMPKENVDRLLARFESRKGNLINCILEGFGPHGVPVMVEIETDNKNRILGEIRLIFKNSGGSLGEEGSVAYFFDRVGEIVVSELDEAVQLTLIDAGAKDFDGNSVLTEVVDLKRVEEEIKKIGLVVEESGIVMRAKSPILLDSESDLNDVVELVECLEENDDVVNVFAGFDYHE
jgi:YebC/PmpR family DNA-binding regulatory protein